MGARILDGAALALTIREELKPQAAAVRAARGRPPGLGIVLAGADPASEIYVRNKLKAAAEAGIHAELVRLAENDRLDDVLAAVASLNARHDIDGLIVQSPLPAGMGDEAEARVIDAIAPAKDVDGFTPYNVGRLVQNRPALVACTPFGVMELLDRSGIELKGHAPS